MTYKKPTSNEVTRDQEDYRAFLRVANAGKNENFDLTKTLNKMLLLESQLVARIKKSEYFDVITAEFFRFFSQSDSNILKLKPFFRIRSSGFPTAIFKAFRESDPKIFDRGLNFKFFHWLEKQHLNSLVPDFDLHFQKLKDVRQELCLGCIFLAVNRARLFQFQGRKTRNDTLVWIDTAVEGMLAAIDKFVPGGVSKKGQNDVGIFKSVVIGRMQEALMVEGASTLIKIPSNDKKILYRANLAVLKHKLWQFEDILAFVRESFPNVSDSKLRLIMNAKSVVMESSSSGKDNSSILDYLESSNASTEDTIEDTLSGKQQRDMVREAIEQLPLLQKKLILLMGGFNDSYFAKS